MPDQRSDARGALIVATLLAWLALGFLSGWYARCGDERLQPLVIHRDYVGAERICVVGRWP